ncbi:MAG: putative oxidoreductase [Candidatus Saccharibacteria bacterium]|nr:putative oxidoreductase [Candidatus Saccharibacteria bacterium]
MEPLLTELRQVLEGEVFSDKAQRYEYCHDASIYEIIPDAVLWPKHAHDISSIVKMVSQHKSVYPSLAITARSAGTDMSGAAIGESLILDMTRHFNQIHSASATMLHTQPGVFMRDIDPLLAEHGVMLGSVPASRAINTIGGMVANNSGGEQSLRYGNTERWVREVKAVLSDGHEYTIRPLTKKQLDEKMTHDTFEGRLYKNVFDLIEAHYDLIKNARPHVNKNSMGYGLWDVWDRDKGIFDMTHLISGSQGTLGIITDIKMEPVPKAKHTGLLLAYLPSTKLLEQVIPLVVSHNPATFEGFDDVTFNLGIRYFKTFQRQLGMKEWLKQQAALLGSVAKFKGHLPNIVLMIEFEGETYEEVNDKIISLQADFARHHVRIRTDIEGNEEMSKPFWEIRRASLALLRQRVKSKYASPFMDDLTVQPKFVPEFFPKVRAIIRKYKLPATIAGHFGDGNFHIIPLMDITSHADQQKLEPAMRELVGIVKQYGGTLAGEHNDGMVRGPWLRAMFGDEMFQIFKQTKELFDPLYIFNPHKKTDASWDYSMSRIRSEKTRQLIK